jgi:hypothetical protein
MRITIQELQRLMGLSSQGAKNGHKVCPCHLGRYLHDSVFSYVWQSGENESFDTVASKGPTWLCA